MRSSSLLLLSLLVLLTTSANTETSSSSSSNSTPQKRPLSTNETTLFKGVDTVHDGLIEPAELKTFLSQNIGGEDFDSAEEIDKGITEVMDNILMGSAGKGHITSKDLTKYWRRLGAMMTVNEVADVSIFLCPRFHFPDLFGCNLWLTCGLQWIKYGLSLPNVSGREW